MSGSDTLLAVREALESLYQENEAPTMQVGEYHNFVEKKLYDALTLLDAYIAGRGWQDVGDGLFLTESHPVNSLPYLVRTWEGNHFEAWYEKAFDAWFARSESDTMQIYGVSHYMPLPAPPITPNNNGTDPSVQTLSISEGRVQKIGKSEHGNSKEADNG